MFANKPEIQLIKTLLENQQLDTSTCFTDAELADIDARARVIGALNHSRSGGRGRSYLDCVRCQQMGEIAEAAVSKLLNAVEPIYTREEPSDQEYYYDGLLLGSFKIEVKCLKMLNTTISWSNAGKFYNMAKHLDKLDCIIVTKWSPTVNVFLPWYLLNPKTFMERMTDSHFKGFFYTDLKGIEGHDFVKLNRSFGADFFNQFKHETIEEPDEIVVTTAELSQGAQLSIAYEGLAKADHDIATYPGSF